VRRFADRLLGSSEIYGHDNREAEQSVNFVTCHDGFTLNDLVSYNQKHNENNREENRDGANDNRSWNCGVEGPTDEVSIEELRNRQAKNFLTVTALSLGLPMLVMGDEVRRTQLGNNNAYCQDNEVSWFDWSLIQKHADLHRFAKTLISRERLRGPDPEIQGMSLTEIIKKCVKGWHGTRLNEPDWSDHSHCIALSAELPKGALRVHLIFNAYWEPLNVELPGMEAERGDQWRRWIDTSLQCPEDITKWQDAPLITGFTYRVGPRSVVVLWATGE
jgi:glycogen operon protein